MGMELSPERVEPEFRRKVLGPLDAAAAQRAMAGANDVAIIVDRSGVIQDLAVNTQDLRLDGVDGWLGKRWTETVSADSRDKAQDVLNDLTGQTITRWREVNHPTAGGGSVALRYMALDIGQRDHIVVIGRDNSHAAALQQRLLLTQQSLERDYARLRDSETRYRALFQVASEAVLIVDAANRRIVEANPAADRTLSADGALIGRPFARLFAAQSQEAAASLLSVAQANPSGAGSQARLTANGRELLVKASVFRQHRAAHFLIRLAPADRKAVTPSDAALKLLDLIERIPDAFVVTDQHLNIMTHNSAFLDLARIASSEQAVGHPLDRFLGRPGIDAAVLHETLRAHGVARNFRTVLRTELNDLEDVEVNAVAAPDDDKLQFGFSIRGVSRRDLDKVQPRTDLPQSAAEMSELVGRIPLRDIVRDTTDLVERMCIEAALKLTGDNRASAAELLGLSRQSLYSKLHRFGIGAGDETA
jgi:transcriptional regulator PpsR